MNNNPIAKVVASLIAIAIMGFIIFFVFQYYDKEARKNPNDNSSQSNNSDKNNPDKDKESDNKSSYKIEEYSKTKEIIIINGEKVIIEYELTDGGNVILVNDNPVSYVPSTSSVKYIVTDKYLVLYVEDYDMGDLIEFIDSDGNILKSLTSIEYNGDTFDINDPVVNKDVKSSFEIIKDYLYVTYVNREIDFASDDDTIQFSYGYDLNDESSYSNEKIYFEYLESDK